MSPLTIPTADTALNRSATSTSDSRPEPARVGVFYLESLGCAGNRADGDRVRALFERCGWAATTDPSQADTVIVQTCGVTRFQEDKNVGRIGELTALKRPGASLLIGGCLPAISRDAVARFSPTMVFGPRQLKRAAEFAKSAEDPDNLAVVTPSHVEDGVATVRVATGCLDHCTYCAIPFANGRITSRSIAAIERDVVAAAGAGFPIVHLVGEDIGAWGRERGDSMLSLLRHLTDLPIPVAFQVDNLNPNWLVHEGDALYDLLVSPKILPRYYIPVESGSDAVLRRMKRRYTARDVLTAIGALRARRPRSYFSTDFVVGFPGETDEDFATTQRIISEINPDFASIYKYEDRNRTESAHFVDKIDETVKETRTRALIADMIALHAARLGIVSVADLAQRLREGLTLPINTNISLEYGECHVA